MKKYSLVVLTILMLILPIVVYSNALSLNKDDVTAEVKISYGSFTHTVLAEDVALSYCPHCPPASDALYSIYQSDDYPFYYVTFVSDKNPISKERLYYLHTKYVPTVYFDGGYIVNVGTTGDSHTDEDTYREFIEEDGMRTVKHLDIHTNVTWLGNAKIKVTVSVTNNDKSIYLGVLRSYITEIVSRWNDQSGDPFHFGFLDFAIKKFVFIPPGKTYTTSATWDGTIDHEGQTFGDITEDNTMIISSISHWLPHPYKDDESGKTYFMFYVDQTDGAIP